MSFGYRRVIFFRSFILSSASIFHLPAATLFSLPLYAPSPFPLLSPVPGCLLSCSSLCLFLSSTSLFHLFLNIRFSSLDFSCPLLPLLPLLFSLFLLPCFLPFFVSFESFRFLLHFSSYFPLFLLIFRTPSTVASFPFLFISVPLVP